MVANSKVADPHQQDRSSAAEREIWVAALCKLRPSEESLSLRGSLTLREKWGGLQPELTTVAH